MQVKQTKHALILQDIPVLMWCTGIFLLFAGGFVLYGGLGGYQLRPQDWWIKPASIAASLVLFWLGFKMPVWHPFIKTTIDRSQRTVTIKQNSLYQHAVNNYTAGEVQEFLVGEDTDDDNDPVWFVELALSNLRRVPLASSRTYDQKKCAALVARANDFLRR